MKNNNNGGAARKMTTSVVLLLAQLSAASVCLYPGSNPHTLCNFTGETVPEGSVLACTCDDGYTLLGAAHRHCINNGTWDQQPPICAVDVADNNNTNFDPKCTAGSDGFHRCPGIHTISINLFQQSLVHAVVVMSNQELNILLDGATTMMAILNMDSQMKTHRLTLSSPLVATQLKLKVLMLSHHNIGHIQVLSNTSVPRSWCRTVPGEKDYVRTLSLDCYSFLHTRSNFGQAVTSCGAQNGSLPGPISPLVQSFLEHNANWAALYYYIGLNHTDRWRWLDGSALRDHSFVAEAGNETGRCAVLRRKSGYHWYPRECHMLNSYVCKTRPVRCGAPGRPWGTLLMDNPDYEEGDMVRYACPRGYRLDGGDPVRRCIGGQWTGEPPRCVLLSEGGPGAMEAHLDLSTTYVAVGISMGALVLVAVLVTIGTAMAVKSRKRQRRYLWRLSLSSNNQQYMDDCVEKNSVLEFCPGSIESEEFKLNTLYGTARTNIPETSTMDIGVGPVYIQPQDHCNNPPVYASPNHHHHENIYEEIDHTPAIYEVIL